MKENVVKVPFLNLKLQYDAHKDEFDSAIHEVIEASAFAGGPFVAGFEEDYAKFCGTKHAIGVGNGTDALWVALLGLGVGRGDEVITAANTFIATAEAITYAGATPVFVDIDAATFNMDPAKLEAAITPRTKAIIPVHLYGQMADMDPILEVARGRGIQIIEDASQAQGAEYRGMRAGSIGEAGCFSFYPGKNLGAFGEAGGVVTNNDGLAARIRRFRDHGQSKKYYHDEVGWNARMDGIQGAVLKVKLKYLQEANEARRRNAALYTQLLSGVEGIILPEEAPHAKHIYHIFAVRVHNREEMMNRLLEKHIHCAIHYPVPLHLQKAYADMKLGEGAFPVTEALAKEIVSLPMFPELTREQIEYTAEEIKHFLKPHGSNGSGGGSRARASSMPV